MIKKIIGSLFAGVVMICLSATAIYSIYAATNGSNEPVIYGDFDNDKRSTVFDLCLAREQLLSQDTQEANVEAHDINGDGDLSLADVVQLQQFLLGSRKEFSRSDIEPNTSTTATTTETTSGETTTTERPYFYLEKEALLPESRVDFDIDKAMDTRAHSSRFSDQRSLYILCADSYYMFYDKLMERFGFHLF
ncbi:MAG: dockerin type I repeat-containing protein [Ruminococcus sp.]|nr:dockerin type I repeat-containing protein [Ruminococcus sp.]